MSRPITVFLFILSLQFLSLNGQGASLSCAKIYQTDSSAITQEISPVLKEIEADLSSVLKVSKDSPLAEKGQEILSKITAHLNDQVVSKTTLDLIFQYVSWITWKEAPHKFDSSLELMRNRLADIQSYEKELGLQSTVLVSFKELSIGEITRLWGTGVMPLGLTKKRILADGRMMSPAEFLLHDLAHYRLSVRWLAQTMKNLDLTKEQMEERRLETAHLYQNFFNTLLLRPQSVEKNQLELLWFYVTHESSETFISAGDFKTAYTAEEKYRFLNSLENAVRQNTYGKTGIPEAQNNLKTWSKIWLKLEALL